MTVPWMERLTLPDRRTLAIAGLVVVGVLIVVGGVWYWQAIEARRAASAYGGAMARLAATRARGATPETRAAAVRELETALSTHPSATMAAHAALELGGLRFADRQYAQARSAYSVTLARGGGPTLRTLARLGIASTWEAEGDLAKAAEAYRTALADLKAGDFLYEQSLVDLARVQEVGGRKTDAVETYRRLLKDVPTTRRAEDIRARLASLGATP